MIDYVKAQSRLLRSESKAKQWQFLAFLIAGGASVPINLLSRIVFSHFTSFEWAIVLSHLVGMLTAFTLSRLFVFAPSGRSVMSELVRFAFVNIFSLLQTWVVAVLLVDTIFPEINMTFYPEITGHFIGLSTSAVTSYFGHKYVSFSSK